MRTVIQPKPGVFERVLRMKLKEYMNKNGLSQRELAEKLCITEVRMSRIMRMEISIQRMDVVSFLNIAVILDTPPDKLLKEIVADEDKTE